MYCKDCKWWERDIFRTDLGSCLLAEMIKGENSHLNSLALVTTEWNGALVTQENFGCVQFEEKAGQ